MIEQFKHRYFPVLDHGFVALVDIMGNDQAIVDAAHTSYGAGTTRVSKDRALIRYLYRHRHTTPFEMVELKFHCKMPIFVARQWIRHRTANINEYSGRYSLMPMQFYTPKREQVATQSSSNRQGRSGNLLQVDEYEAFVAELEELRENARGFYEKSLGLDVAREVARIDLPLSLYTEWYWKIDLHNLLHFLGLRCDAHAQWEVRQYADIMSGIVKVATPLAHEAWCDYHPNMGAEMFSRQEMLLLRKLIIASEHHGEHYLVPAREDEDVSVQDMELAGLSKRECKEFLERFSGEPHERPTFDLDLSVTKDASYFAAETAKYVPKV